MKESYVSVNGFEVKLTNLDKLLWPDGLTKAHLVKYYAEIAPYILPHLYNRPIVMKRYPDGISGESFYQKEFPDYAPGWIKTQLVKHGEKTVHYIICNNRATLIWLANQACIEMHAWLSRTENLEAPDIAVMDLDPSAGASFSDTLKVALLVGEVFEKFGLKCFPKTSGARGLHLFAPVDPVYSWLQVTAAVRYVAEKVGKMIPDIATTERKISLRNKRVYLDYLQNGRGKTMAFPYSLRPAAGAPVSTPLNWREIEKGDVYPPDFNIKTIFARLSQYGDLYAGVLNLKQSMDELVNAAEKEYFASRKEK
ncbi:MAG TPA: non-homologous end-joining DNA ligase [Bacillota bacterium]|nr:non-homologous end-joining DNA ligase [Bacillota bacterium]